MMAALALGGLYLACSQTAAGQQASLAPLTSPHVTVTHPAHQALNASSTTAVSATFSADMNASTITSATLMLHAMQSGWVSGTLSYDALAHSVTLTPSRALHMGEVVRGHATAGMRSIGGEALTPYQWQFTVGQVNPIAPCGFVDVDAGLTSVRNSSVAWADYDGDGRLDILLAGQDSDGEPVSKLYRNEGGGAFTEVAAGLTGVAWGSVAWGDYDNDGRPDILLTGEEGFLDPVAAVYHNNGDGTFTDIGAGLTGVQYSAVAWGDYDNDGWLDILLTGYDPFNSVTELWRNQGNGAFTRVATALPDVGEGAVAWGDYDNDGDLDLLLTGFDSAYSPVAQLWRNDGGGSFTQAVTLTGVSDGSVAWGDYDRDGWLDLLLTGYDSAVVPLAQVLRNHGDGSLSDIGAGLAGVGYSAVAWGDYDRDGWLDILLTGSDINGTALADIYRNDGAGAFVRFGGAALTGVWYGSAAWGDFDGAGRLGILLTGQYAPYNQTSPLSRVYRSADECHADLKITKRAEPSAAVPGATITYYLDFSNLGSLTAAGVVIRDSVPPDILDPVIVSHSGAAITPTGSAPDFAWQVENLVAGLGGAIVLQGTLAELDPDIVVTNLAEIGSPLDVNLSNNHPTARVTVLEASPPVSPTISIRRQISDVLLSWADHPANGGGYLAWRSTQPYFQPFDTGAISVTLSAGITHTTHVGAVGAGLAYSYLVQGVNAVGVRSAPSNRVGVFGFSLTPGAP
jgi:uncharacterized repeat protein (TIGR01451 family)